MLLFKHEDMVTLVQCKQQARLEFSLTNHFIISFEQLPLNIIFCLTRVQPGVLLHVRQLLEPPVAVGALVRLLPSVDANVLHQLVVGRKSLQALGALVGLHIAAPTAAARPAS